MSNWVVEREVDNQQPSHQQTSISPFHSSRHSSRHRHNKASEHESHRKDSPSLRHHSRQSYHSNRSSYSKHQPLPQRRNASFRRRQKKQSVTRMKSIVSLDC